MTPTALLAELRAVGVVLAARNGRLAITAPPGSLTTALREALRDQREALLALLTDAAQSISPIPPETTATPQRAGDTVACAGQNGVPARANQASGAPAEDPPRVAVGVAVPLPDCNTRHGSAATAGSATQARSVPAVEVEGEHVCVVLQCVHGTATPTATVPTPVSGAIHAWNEAASGECCSGAVSLAPLYTEQLRPAPRTAAELVAALPQAPAVAHVAR